MAERTTEDLICVLGSDVQRAHAELVSCIKNGPRDLGDGVTTDHEYHARQLVRAILAYIEGVTFSVKVWSTTHCLDSGIEVTHAEELAAVEVDTDLNDKGEIVERPAKLRLASNIRFAFHLLERAKPGTVRFDPTAEWWSDLRKTIAVRDRLTHPRFPEDLDVSGAEIITALHAREGFEKTILEAHKVPIHAPEPTVSAVTPRRGHEDASAGGHGSS